MLHCSLPRLAFASYSFGLISAAFTADSKVLQGEGPNRDWKIAAPGVEYHITAKDLPANFAAPSARNKPKIVARPEDTMPQVPEGFEIKEFATGFKIPAT